MQLLKSSHVWRTILAIVCCTLTVHAEELTNSTTVTDNNDAADVSNNTSVAPIPTTPRGPTKCVVCDSVLNPGDCAPWDAYSHVKTCPGNSGGCRTIYQTVYTETRVIRQCTNLTDEKVLGCITRVGTHRIKMQYCHCIGDLCNAATSPFTNGSTFLLSLIMGISLLLIRG